MFVAFMLMHIFFCDGVCFYIYFASRKRVNVKFGLIFIKMFEYWKKVFHLFMALGRIFFSPPPPDWPQLAPSPFLLNRPTNLTRRVKPSPTRWTGHHPVDGARCRLLSPRLTLAPHHVALELTQSVDPPSCRRSKGLYRIG
jgi:hypothetical protein